MKQYWSALTLLGSAVLVFPACNNGGGSTSGGSSASMDLNQVSSGFNQLLPHQALRLDANGNPTQQLISIRTDADLLANVTSTNPILPVPQYPTSAILPSGDVGNHFVFAEFTSDIDIASVLDASPGAQANGNLTGTVTLVALDPTTGAITPVQARAFINGYTFGNSVIPDSNPPALPFEQWATLDPDDQSATFGRPIAVAVDGQFPGANFPGVAHDFAGADKLFSPRTIVFVADTNGDLTDNETFPANRELRLRITTAVRNMKGAFMKRQATVTFTVGADVLRPEVARTPPPLNEPLVTPSNGTSGVDPLTNVRIEFTEDIQPWSLGSLPTGAPPLPSSALSITFGPSTMTVAVPFNVMPISVYDLTTYQLIPGFNFPGEGPDVAQCGVFNRVTIGINPQQVKDLVANQNLLGGSTFFDTGEGPGLVNAPVLPDTIYVGRSGAIPGLSVIDLNGFGQSTGNPHFYDASNNEVPQEGDTNFPNNPNLALQGASLIPPLVKGDCTINGGSAGVFTLTKDSSLNDLLVRAPVLTSIGDMMVGHSLDSTFNNGPAPFGCQSGGGNLCAFDQIKILNPTINGATGVTLVPTGTGQVNGTISPGAENVVCWAPHPNPPTLAFPPLCISPFIGGQEPTSIDSPGLNFLGPGDPFGDPHHTPLSIPPSGLLTPEQNSFFEGPSLSQTPPSNCTPYMIRQQIGQFLYVIDRGRQEIVVLNSNRMTVLDRIPLADPTTMAMSPNLNLLAVANQLSDLVSFIDIDPNSATFHQIVQETIVGHRPRGIAWEPGDEDILCCNESDNSLSVISAASLTVRKTVSSQLDGPFEVAVTPRQLCWGFNRQVYFGWVLNRSGRVAIFESGPNTVNGWGYDNIIGIANSTFNQPKTLQPDHVDLRGGVWIVHEGPLDIGTGAALPGQETTGAVSKLVIESAIPGALPLNFQSLTIPQFRDMYLGVPVSLGADKLSGVPVDIAFDNLRNVAGLPNTLSTFTSSTSIPVNGKGLVKNNPGCPGIIANNHPRYMFVAVPTPLVGQGVVDVIRIDQNNSRVDTSAYQSGTQSIPAPDVQVLMDFFRQ
ncbi:MAG: YncE family protein [Planctomycetes bacterium]|nr:YncE family protein [Planctomycetota bacterium]